MWGPVRTLTVPPSRREDGVPEATFPRAKLNRGPTPKDWAAARPGRTHTTLSTAAATERCRIMEVSWLRLSASSPGAITGRGVIGSNHGVPHLPSDLRSTRPVWVRDPERRRRSEEGRGLGPPRAVFERRRPDPVRLRDPAAHGRSGR